MPAGIGRWLLGSALGRAIVDRLTRQGKIVRTTSLIGFLQLYAIAQLAAHRAAASLRFRHEQAAIDAWLAQLRPSLPSDYALAVAVAACPRLLKGYGDTHARGSRNFDHRRWPRIPALRQAAGRRRRASARLRDAALGGRHRREARQPPCR